MTVSGCNGGAEKATDDNLDPKHYEDFARYLVEVCKHYKETYGIEFRTLDPFNEPETNYWYRNGGQEGCHFDVKSQVKFLRVLSPVLKESGLKTVFCGIAVLIHDAGARIISLCSGSLDPLKGGSFYAGDR